jgi:hypothetical protein
LGRAIAEHLECCNVELGRRCIVRVIGHTGGLISSAAAITASSFASFLISPLGSLRQLGFALVAGILIDAMLVRPLLVPCGRWLLSRTRKVLSPRIVDKKDRREYAVMQDLPRPLRSRFVRRSSLRRGGDPRDRAERDSLKGMIMANVPRGDIWDSELDGDIPSRSKTRWNGRTVEVTAHLIPRYFWSTASIDVFLDGECILQTGGQLKTIGSSEAEFHHDGSVHAVKLTWGSAHHLSFPYQLWIDGAKVLVSDVPVANPVLIVMPGLVLTSPLWVTYLLSFL